MAVKVLSGPPHDCKRDGHSPALRARWDLDSVVVNPFCTECGMVGLPSSSFVDTTGFLSKWLMGIVDGFRFAPDAPPEAYEGMFS